MLGLIYPAVMVLFGQLVFPSQANGSLITRNGKTVGLEAGRAVVQRPALLPRAPVRGRLQRRRHQLRQPRPERQALRDLVKTRIAKIMALEWPYNPGLTVQDIPVDAVTASGSGIDPEISKPYAYLQAPRIAAVRHLPLATVRQLIN